ncbi:MAG: AarF/UbiB family protein, partial [Pseudomonadota bacterium]
MIIIRSARNTIYLVKIFWTLFRHNALFFWRKKLDFKLGKNLANALEELGPSYIKLGQVLSTRSDIVGQEMALALTELQDHVPPFETKIVHEIIKQQLGDEALQIFAEFDDNPTAAASIAQVPLALTHEGKKVAVKILRPGIEDAFARDIELLFWLADLADYWLPSLRRFKLAE